jgi:hypothetical protein
MKLEIKTTQDILVDNTTYDCGQLVMISDGKNLSKKWVSVDSLKHLLESAMKHNEYYKFKNGEMNEYVFGMIQAHRALLAELEKTE